MHSPLVDHRVSWHLIRLRLFFFAIFSLFLVLSPVKPPRVETRIRSMHIRVVHLSRLSG